MAAHMGHAETTTATIAEPILQDRATHSGVGDAGQSDLLDKGKPRYRSSRRTASSLAGVELGDEKVRDWATGTEHQLQDELHDSRFNPEAARTRSELSRDLLTRIDELIPAVDTISLSTRINLFKRDLIRCHDALGEAPTESDFLSIVTLLESTLSQKRWRDYTVQDFRHLRDAVEVGYNNPQVGYADYEAVRVKLFKAGMDGNPSIKLENMDLDGLDDAEET